MRVTFISDTHCKLSRIPPLEGGDLLVHSGDLTNRGSASEIAKELEVLRNVGKDYKHIIFVPGNHDFFFEKEFTLAKSYAHGINVLKDDLIELEGLKIYGSPWVPKFFDWAFMLERDSEELKRQISFIPDGLDLLVTHGPPYAILDETEDGEMVGCKLLRDRIATMADPPRRHAFGHIHASYGIMEYVREKDDKEVTFINAATCGENYKPTNPPITMEF